ncbi:MAG: hypothetical protein AB1752_05890 [Candidatus Zixiibacteriota bacterium]
MSRLNSAPYDVAFRILEPEGQTLWSNLNFIVVGPPGSGKLSLTLALSRALFPGKRLLLCDWETEEDTQIRTMERLHARISRNLGRNEPGTIGEILVLRHIHRLPLPMLTALLDDLDRAVAKADEIDGYPRLLLRATCHEPPACDEILTERLRRLFPCEIRMAGLPLARAYLAQFVTDLVRELNRTHGRRVTEVEGAVVDEICRIAPGLSLHELRTIVERSYLETEGGRLSELSHSEFAA